MAQRLSTLVAALPEHQGLLPSNHMVALNYKMTVPGVLRSYLLTTYICTMACTHPKR